MQRWAPHLLGLVTPLVAIFGILMGGWWSGSVIVLLLILYPLLDVVFGNDDAGSRVNQGRAFDIILHLHGLLVPIAIVILLWQIHVAGWSQFMALGAVSIGFSSGASGIVTAHELGHRRPRRLLRATPFYFCHIPPVEHRVECIILRLQRGVIRT